MSDDFGGDLKISIDHGDQHLEFWSPGGEGNHGITPEDDVGFSLGDVVSAPAKAVTGGAKAAAKGAKTVAKGAKVVAKGSAKVATAVVETPAQHAAGVAKFTANAAKAAGRGAHSVVKYASKATGEISDLVEKVPYAGKPFSTVIGAASEPLQFARAVASGRRIDKAALDSVKRTARAARDLAPYAQIVVASVPGLGTGVAAGIAGGLALAEGKSIDEAAVAACRAAVPGGPVAQAAFDAAVAAGQGESVDEIMRSAALSSLPPDQRAQARAAMEVAAAVSSGKPVGEALLRGATAALDEESRKVASAALGKDGAAGAVYDELTRKLPPSVRGAMVSGVALGFAEKLQGSIAEVAKPETVSKLAKTGAEVVGKSEVLRQAEKQAPDKRAFAVGIGIMQYGGVPPKAIEDLRDSLGKGRARLSFDAALAVYVGAAVSPKFPRGARAAVKAGTYITVGSVAGSKTTREALVRAVARKNAEMMVGVAQAVRRIRRERSWWRRLVRWLTGSST